MAHQSSAPLQFPLGKDTEGVSDLNVDLIKNDVKVGEKGNGAAIIENNTSSSIPLQTINDAAMDDKTQPSLKSSADNDGDAVMENAAASDKPSSTGGEAHVERTLHDNNINNNNNISSSSNDTVDAVTTAPLSNSNNNEGAPIVNPLATNTQPTLQSGGKNHEDDERQQKILSSIQHRRRLLAWVRESRIACEQSRRNISNGTKKGFVAALLEEQQHVKQEKGDGGNNSTAAATQQDATAKPSSASAGKITTAATAGTTITPAEEIANYNKVAKLANSATALQRKKSNSTILTENNAAQRDLRRGSNIGKRMSAAVTTLNNFGNVGGWASTDTSISGDAISSSSGGGGGGGGAKAPNNVSSSSITAANNGKLLPNKAGFPPSVGKQLDPTAVQSSSSTTTTTLSSKVPTEKLSKKARKRASNIKKTGGITNADGSSNHVGGIAVSKHATVAKPTDKSTSYLTLSAGAIRLRDRRDELAQKLINLLQKQHGISSSGGVSNGGEKRKADVDETSPFSPRKRTKNARTKTAQSSLTKLSSLSEMGLAKEATRLPPRRMTQWDCVLEEMRWMASDFIEERKWKVACGKALSSSVRQHIDEQKLAAKSAKGKSKNTPNKSDDISAATGTPANPISSTKSTKSVDSKSNDRRKMSISDSNPLYVDPSNNDVEHSRKISQLLSLTVSDHWDIALTKGAFPLTDDDYKAGYERYRKVRGELLGETSEICVKSSTVESPLPPPPTHKELKFDVISKKMQESVEAVKSLKTKSDEALSKERALQKYRKSLTCGVQLSKTQLKAVHFIESIWGSRDDMSVAAVLGGNVGTGKTIVGCSTLWKNRLAGAQLVLCSPASLVSLLRGSGYLSRILCSYVSYCIYAFLQTNSSVGSMN